MAKKSMIARDVKRKKIVERFALKRAALKASFEAAAVGVVFNFLSNRPDEQWHDKDLGPARRFDTIRWLDWSLHLTSLVRFAQDYLDGHDATIVIEKGEPSAINQPSGG